MVLYPIGLVFITRISFGEFFQLMNFLHGYTVRQMM